MSFGSVTFKRLLIIFTPAGRVPSWFDVSGCPVRGVPVAAQGLGADGGGQQPAGAQRGEGRAGRRDPGQAGRSILRRPTGRVGKCRPITREVGGPYILAWTCSRSDSLGSRSPWTHGALFPKHTRPCVPETTSASRGQLKPPGFSFHHLIMQTSFFITYPALFKINVITL